MRKLAVGLGLMVVMAARLASADGDICAEKCAKAKSACEKRADDSKSKCEAKADAWLAKEKDKLAKAAKLNKILPGAEKKIDAQYEKMKGQCAKVEAKAKDSCKRADEKCTKTCNQAANKLKKLIPGQ